MINAPVLLRAVCPSLRPLSTFNPAKESTPDMSAPRNSFPIALEDAKHLDQYAKETAEQLGCTELMTRVFLRAAFVAAQVFDHKQRNYGPGNIARFGETGVLIRLNDKIERRVNLWKRGGVEPTDETIEDTWGDIVNYGLIALLCRWGLWPGVEATPAARAVMDRKQL